VAELPLFGESEIAFLEALRRAGVEFLVVGLSAAALQGAPVVTRDVDLWMRDLTDARFHAVLGRFGATYVPPVGLNPPMLVGRRIAMFDIVASMHGLDDFVAEHRRSREIELGATKVRVLPLDRIIASKRAANRPKDRAVLPVLENVLRTIKEARPALYAAPGGKRPRAKPK
jgi:hypothetical protein